MEETGADCLACPAQCKTCTTDIKVCAECVEGYKIEGTECKKSSNAGMVAGIVIGVIAVIAIAGALIWYFMFYQKGSAVSAIETGVP